MNRQTIRKGILLFLVAVGLASCFKSCSAGSAAQRAALQREALSLKWMHDMGYLVPPERGVSEAFDQLPDWDEVVYELQETNLATAFSSLESFAFSGIAMLCLLALPVVAWPAKAASRAVTTETE